MKKQANKTASSGSSDKDTSAESSAPEEGEVSDSDSNSSSSSSIQTLPQKMRSSMMAMEKTSWEMRKIGLVWNR